MIQISTDQHTDDKQDTFDFGMGEQMDYHQPLDFVTEPVYSPEAIVALTSFSEEVIQNLYAAVMRLAGPNAKSANVSWSTTKGSTDCRLDLVVRVDANWDEIEAWEYAIQDKITEWSGKWTELQWDEYSQGIFHSLVPVHL